MNITAGILFYLLNKNNEMQHICHGADRIPLKRLEYFRDQQEIEGGILYFHAQGGRVIIFCPAEKQRSANVLAKAVQSGNDSISSLLISYENLSEEFGKKDCKPDKIFAHIGQVWNDFMQIQNAILENLISQEKAEIIMGRILTLIRKPFVVVDRDMMLLYEHPDIPRLMTEAMGKGYKDDIVEELLMAKEFHEVAGKREPFYYDLDSFDQGSYCINILVEGYYYARLVVYVDKGETKLPSGAEQITEYMGSVIVEMIRAGVLKLHRNQNDKLHMICQILIDGGTVKDGETKDAAKYYHWNPDDSLQIICFEPHQATGWETHIENTMPTMTRKLEQMRIDSCAVFSGRRILWLVNETKSSSVKGSHEQKQDLMVFLRENAFRAGGSSIFKNAGLIASAVKAAEAALEIGLRKDPTYWFYNFDDYRLEYMIDAIRSKEIAHAMLVHPAIPILTEHDRKNESELCKTLQTVIEKRGNVTQAADALYIHRTTLFRRLNQIKELTGIDPDDPNTTLMLQLSYRFN